MKAILPFIVTFLFLFTFYQAMIPENPLSAYAGVWVNTEDDGHITRLIISVNDSQVIVQAFGNCYPEDCDWGEVVAEPFLSGINTSAKTNAEALTAEFLLDSRKKVKMARTLTIIPESDAFIQVRQLTAYLDGSGRSAQTAVERLKQVGP